MRAGSAKVLLVEDDVVDVKGVKRAFAVCGLENSVTVAADGRTALEILRGATGASALDRPYVLVLDLNMPRMNGLELLREIRADAALKDTVVFVLTTSNDEGDRSQAHEHDVAGYFVKSGSPEIHLAFARSLAPYLSIADLP